MNITNPLEVTQRIELSNHQTNQFTHTDLAAAIARIPNENEFKLRHISVLQAISSIPGVSAGVEVDRRQSVGGTIQPPAGAIQREPNVEGLTTGDGSLAGEGCRRVGGERHTRE